MRRRAASSIEDSMELLLDTICNTFGGILFISLLVVLLINTSVPPSTREQQYTHAVLELLELGNIRDQLVREELEDLHRELQSALRQQQVYFNSVARPEDAQLVASRQTLDRHALVLLKRISETEKRLTQLEQDRFRIHSQLRETQQALETANDASRKTQLELEKQLQKNSRALILRAAQARSISGSATYILQNGKLFGSYESDSGDFVMTRGLFGSDSLRADSFKGLPIPTNTEDLEAVRRKIGRVNSVRVFVASDSYGAWKLVERVLQQSNTSYEVVPTGSDSVTLYFTSTSIGGYFQ